MPRSLLRALSFLAAMVVTGCLTLPIPHHVVPTGHVYGRVVDGVTHQPVPGADVELAQQETKTSTEGRFEFTPQPEWHIFFVAVLLPERPFCGDDLYITKMNYRSESMRVTNCPIILGDGDTKNATITDDVSDIYLTPDNGPIGH